MAATTPYRRSAGTCATRRTRPLSIALLSEFVHPFHKGGAERRYYELATRLADRGHDIHWFAMKHWGRDVEPVYEGIRLHSIGDPIDVYTETGSRSVRAALHVGWRLLRALSANRQRFDVIDCSLYPFFHIFGCRLIRPRTPLVITWYEFWGDHWYQYLGWRGVFGKWTELFASRAGSHIIAVSDMAAKGLSRAGVTPGRIAVVPLGVDATLLDSIPPAVDEGADVVSFGRLKNHKNVDVLLEAVARLRPELPSLTCAVIGDGPERIRLEALARALGIAQSVQFHGEVSEARMFSIAKASRLFVNASTKEGGGSISVLEANACGLPVIAVDHPMGIDRSLVREGKNGWWAPAATPDDLAATIARALGALGAERRETVAKACKDFARSNDWDRMTDECEEIYWRIARGGKE